MEEFSRLVELMATLRGDNGCPWDKKQTVKSFKTFLLEEVYELIEAIDKEDYQAIKEELGDLLFHIVFISQICQESGLFDIREVVSETFEKMFRRHPHVFSSDPQEQPVEMKWEEIKKAEKADYSPLDQIPRTLPALLRAYSTLRRAARTGVPLEAPHDTSHLLCEEIDKLAQGETIGSSEETTAAIGLALLRIVNIARMHDVDPEDALRSAADRFVREGVMDGGRESR